MERHKDGKAKNPHHGPNQGRTQGGSLDAVRALRPARAGGHRRSVVQEMPPGRQQKKSRDKGPLTRPGSPVIAPLNPGQLGPLVSPFAPLGSPLTASAGRPGPFRPPHFSNRRERVNCLFPQACVILGSFPRLFTSQPFRAIAPIHVTWSQKLRLFTSLLQVVKDQVVQNK